MKHATPATLRLIDALLVEVRRRPELRERTPGAFYFKAKGYLHFHEDPAGIFADVKLDHAEFTRMRVSATAEQRKLIEAMDRSLKAAARSVAR